MKEDVLLEGWEKINIQKAFSQVSTTGKKIPTKDILPFGKYPVIDQGEEFISGYFNNKDKVISANSGIVIFGDHTRNFKLVNFDFIPGGDGTKILKPNVGIDLEFFYFQCLYLELPDKGYHRHFKYFKESNFYLPPLPEQQYLSQKLTALLDEVAQTKQRLEAIPALLKQFRQSVLADAVSGILTDSDKYKNHKLKDYFDLIDGDRGPNYPKKDEYSDKGYCLFLSTKNVREFGFDFSECIYISQEKDSVLRKGKLNRGDVIITTRGTLGNVASYDEKVAFDNVRINSGMLILRKKENNILNEYSKILIASPLFKQMITDKQTGSAQPQLPAGILKEFEVPIPSIEQQTQIVQKVETYFALADEIETQVKAALENVNLLTQSILAKAFCGELSAAWRTQQAVKN